jgi:DNA-binding MarR family transcriptional regulator
MQEHRLLLESGVPRRGCLQITVRFDERFFGFDDGRMRPETIFEIQRLFPQIYLACHVDHVRAASTTWDISSHDASILAHLDPENAISPRTLAAHLSVAASTLSAAIARLSRLGYLTSASSSSDKRQREVRLTARGAEALASTSVLDRNRVRELLNRLNARERAAALRGLQLLAQAARQMKQPT